MCALTHTQTHTHAPTLAQNLEDLLFGNLFTHLPDYSLANLCERLLRGGGPTFRSDNTTDSDEDDKEVAAGSSDDKDDTSLDWDLVSLENTLAPVEPQ